jgi:hypothetical protein
MIRRTAGRKKEPSMVTRGVRLLSVVILFLMATGCHSIHSRSVRDLIQLEGTKIDAAQTNIDLFQKETEARIKFLEQARSSLHESFKSLQIQETKHRFALASFRNLTTKKGDAAYAAAYLTSLIYMADAQGLEKAVWNQFEEDFAVCAIPPMPSTTHGNGRRRCMPRCIDLPSKRPSHPSILSSSRPSLTRPPTGPARSWRSWITRVP